METEPPESLAALKRRIRHAESCLERMIARLDADFNSGPSDPEKDGPNLLPQPGLAPRDIPPVIVKLHQALSRWVQIEWAVFRYEQERINAPATLGADIMLPFDLDFLEAELRQLRDRRQPAPAILSPLPAGIDPNE